MITDKDTTTDMPKGQNGIHKANEYCGYVSQVHYSVLKLVPWKQVGCMTCQIIIMQQRK